MILVNVIIHGYENHLNSTVVYFKVVVINTAIILQVINNKITLPRNYIYLQFLYFKPIVLFGDYLLNS